MIRAVLVDDEEQAIKGLNSVIRIFCKDIEVVATARSAMEGIKVINQHKPDLVFLDVEMPHADGFDLLESIGEKGFHTIFVTAFDQFAIKALRFNASDYLLKPIDPDDLTAAVERIRNLIQNQQSSDYTNLLNGYKTGNFEKLGVPTSNGTKFITLKDLVHLEASNNYTKIHVLGEKPLLISRTIKSFEKTLEGTPFVRVHQSHIVNMMQVKEYLRTDGGTLVLTNGNHIMVSRSNKAKVDKALKTWLRNL